MSRSSGRMLAHELSNQLGIVVSYAELLLEELGADNPNVPDVERIDRAARRMMRLFEGVTSFEDVGEDVRRQCTDHLSAIRQSAESVLNRAAAPDPLAADIREVIKAAASSLRFLHCGFFMASSASFSRAPLSMLPSA